MIENCTYSIVFTHTVFVLSISRSWKFWPIVHCVTYSVIPAQHRVLWVNSVDLVWNAILSSAAQKGEESEEATTTAAVVDTTNGQTNTTNTVAWVAT